MSPRDLADRRSIRSCCRRFLLATPFAIVLIGLLFADHANGSFVQYDTHASTKYGGSQSHVGETSPNESSIFAPFSVGLAFGSEQAFGAAGHGSLGAFAHATISVPQSGLGGFTLAASGDAHFIIEDFVVTPLPGTIPVATVPVAANLHLSGGLLTAADIRQTHLGGASADASVSVDGYLAGVHFAGQITKHTSEDALTGQVDESGQQTGVLSGGIGLFATPVVNMPVNQPYRLELSLGTSAMAGYGFSGTTTDPTNAFAEAAASFSNTLSFDPSGPAFNVPAGYTVNSVEGMIVDNHWVGAVPEPGTLVLLGLGILALPLSRRHFATRSFASR